MASATPLAFAHIAPGSPFWIYALVIAALAAHIAGGSVAIVSGTVALTARKGGAWHRRSGKVFFVAMLVAAAMAAALAAWIPQRGNVVGGIFAFYLVATAWMTVRRKSTGIGSGEIAGAFVAAAIAAIAIVFGVEAARSPSGAIDGTGAANFYVTAALAAFAAALDIKMILQGGIVGIPRIARHIWRVCTGLFIATGSFFLGQQKVMPGFVQGSPVLFVLALAPLAFLIFWMIRVRFARRFKTLRLQPASVPA